MNFPHKMSLWLLISTKYFLTQSKPSWAIWCGCMVRQSFLRLKKSWMNLDVYLMADYQFDLSQSECIVVKPKFELHLTNAQGSDFFTAARSELWRQSSPSTNSISHWDKIKWGRSFIIISLCLLLSGNTHQHLEPKGKHPCATGWLTKAWFTCTELLL